jgi:alpha-L-rhamnosidase
MRTNADPMMAMRRPRPGTPSFLDGSAGWGDAATIIPWTMYLCYGDRDILERQYESAKAWVDYMAACAKTPNEEYRDTPAYQTYTDGEPDANYIWDTKFHYGEWLEADTNFKDMMTALMGARHTIPYVATAYFAHSSRLLSEMAAVLGYEEDAAKYRTLFEKIRRVYNRYFIREDGTVLEGRQASNVRVLAFGLADESKQQAVADRLAQLVVEQGCHLNTGFLSTPFILPVLAEHGYADIAFRLLEQDTCPSWLYAVNKGATTIWENWNGITPEGELIGSLNHYAYGAVCDFLFSGVAGIRPVWEQPGYKHFLLKPLVGGTLTQASATLESPYGTIRSGWEKGERRISYHFEVPANTTATIMLPGQPDDLAKLSAQYPDARYEDGRIMLEAGSGVYHFELQTDE